MNFIELFINEPATASLDINQEVDIALQYSIADIKDISKRNAAYSKTITLPGTKTNNYWFGNLFDINTDFTQFNPNKKVAAKLLVNTENVIDGFLQLRKIIKLNNTDQSGNMINYEVVIFNNAVDLIQELGEKTINQLDLSQFGHTFSSTNVKASWAHEWRDGYVYPMLGTGTKDSQYKVEYFYPAIFYRTLLDQMIREAGFGWKGSLETNEQFNHEVISYVTDGRPKIDEEERRRRLFYVGKTQSQSYTPPATGTPTPGRWRAFDEVGFPNFPNGLPISLNDETSEPFFDNDGSWNTSIYEWTADRNGQFTCEGSVRLGMLFRNLATGAGSGASSFLWDNEDGAVPEPNPTFRIRICVQKYVNGLWNGAGCLWTQTVDNFRMASFIPGGSSDEDIRTIYFSGPQISLSKNQRVRVVAYIDKPNTPTLYYNKNLEVSYTIYGIGAGNQTFTWFKNGAISADFTQNDYISLASYLPDKVKQKDLLGDLIKRYNLYIQTDPDNPKMLILDTRPDFYNKGEVIDWTHKKDFSSRDEIELLSDLQYKLMIWSYKGDNDYYNKEYSDISGDVYGQYKYFFDNDFVKGEERIESQFSPTPLVKTAFNAIVPAINPENPKVQPRIFYWGGLRDCDGWSWNYQDSSGVESLVEYFTTYPYAGHFDNPISPSIDINFGECKYYFYNDWTSLTANNMFNTYWSDYVRQIETGRLVASYFYLDEYDIRYIKDNFYSKIFIVDSYYYVNKIIDYKPLNNGLTKVELIKIVDGVTWKPKASSRPTTIPSERVVLTGIELLQIGNGNSGTGVVFGTNNTTGGRSVLTGIETFTYSGFNKQLVVGDNNTILGNGLIVGIENLIEEDNSSIISGRNNTILAPNVVMINSNNITATESNGVYLGNNFRVDTITGDVLVGSVSFGPLVYYKEDVVDRTARVEIVSENLITLRDEWSGASGSEYIRESIYDTSFENIMERTPNLLHSNVDDLTNGDTTDIIQGFLEGGPAIILDVTTSGGDEVSRVSLAPSIVELRTESEAEDRLITDTISDTNIVRSISTPSDPNTYYSETSNIFQNETIITNSEYTLIETKNALDPKHEVRITQPNIDDTQSVRQQYVNYIYDEVTDGVNLSYSEITIERILHSVQGGEGQSDFIQINNDGVKISEEIGSSFTNYIVNNDNGFYKSQFQSTGISKGVSKERFVSVETTDGVTASVVYPLSDLEVETGAIAVKATVTALNSDEDTAYVAELYAAVRINSYTPTIISGVDKTEKTEFTSATSTIDIESSNLAILVRGETGETISWSIKYELIYSVPNS